MNTLSIVGGGVLLVLGGLVWVAVRWRSAVRSNRQLMHKFTKLEADLADRRLIERELAHMASFADMAPNPIIEMNGDHSIGYVNPAAERAFPSLAQEGTKHALFDGVLAALELLTREQKTLLTRPVKIQDRIYEQQISLLDGGPRVRLYLADITELKRLDQLKSDFVNMVSHELRTPLTSITASIKMISSGMLGEVTSDQGGTLKLAEVNIDRLSRMINDLLDVSKIEAGKLDLHRAQIDLAVLVKEVCRSFEPLARERGLEIRSRVTPEPIKVWADRDKLLQVFTNLINNALKFTQTGYVEIVADHQGDDVRCQVVDTGPGIAPRDLPKVFGKFEQFGQAPRGHEKGTGLGLSICKGFVELHGGRIWVESELTKGTQFNFVLPHTSPEAIFEGDVRRLFNQAVASQKPLSLLRVMYRGVHAVHQPDLQRLIQTLVRDEQDTFLGQAGQVLIALAEADHAAASAVLERAQSAAQKAGLPADFDVLILSYPEDSQLIEDLLARLKSPVVI